MEIKIWNVHQNREKCINISKANVMLKLSFEQNQKVLVSSKNNLIPISFLMEIPVYYYLLDTELKIIFTVSYLLIFIDN